MKRLVTISCIFAISFCTSCRKKWERAATSGEVSDSHNIASERAAAAEEKQDVPASVVGSKILVIGDLGVPVGKTVTITGRKVSEGRSDNNFRVTTVDGRKFDMSIYVNGIDEWPVGTEATLEGAEVGTLRFLTLEMTNYGRDDPRWEGPYQELFIGFEVDKIVTPANLRMRDDKMHNKP